jgi:hypothetical protein
MTMKNLFIVLTILVACAQSLAASHNVSLAWNASTSPNVNYFIYRGTVSGGPYTKLNSTAQSALTYSDSTVLAGTTYYYVTTSVNSSNMESGYSNQMSVTVPNPAPVSTPVPTPTPTPVPAPIPSAGSLTSSLNWQSEAIENQNAVFTIQFDAVPNGALINGVMGLSQSAASDYTNLATIVRFNPSGFIDARNGANYVALSNIPYSAGIKYHFQMSINISAHTYSAYVTPNGGSQLTIGTNMAFRVEQAAVASLGYLNVIDLNGTYGSGGTFTVSNVTTTSTLSSSLTSSLNWQDEAIPSQSGSFTIQFDAIPNGALINGVMGLSSGVAGAYTDLANILRFNPSGFIDARNGANYVASIIPYSSGIKYHFQMSINISAHTYSAYVTPAGGSQIAIGTNMAFRVEQAAVASLSYLNIVDLGGSYGSGGTFSVSNVQVTDGN